MQYCRLKICYKCVQKPSLLHHREEIANINCPVETNVAILNITNLLHMKYGKISVFTSEDNMLRVFWCIVFMQVDLKSFLFLFFFSSFGF